MRKRVGRFIWVCWAFYMGVRERVGRVRCASVLGGIVKYQVCSYMSLIQVHESRRVLSNLRGH